MDGSSEQHSSNDDNRRLRQYKAFGDKLKQEIYASACYTGQASLASAFVWINHEKMNVHPVLQASACLESLVRFSQLDKLGDAVQLLEYIHTQFPNVCKGSFYTNLYLDLKTKAATSEILSPVVRGDKEAQMKILDKYFDSETCNKATTHANPDTCTTDEERYFALHSNIRTDLMEVITSEQRHVELRGKIFDPILGHNLYQGLVANVNYYVSVIRQQISKPLLIQCSDVVGPQQTTSSLVVSLLDRNPSNSSTNALYSSPVLNLKLQRIPIKNLSTRSNKITTHDGSSQRGATQAQNDRFQASTGLGENIDTLSGSSDSEVDMSAGGEERVSACEKDDETASKKCKTGRQRVLSPRGKRGRRRKVVESDDMDNSLSESSDNVAPVRSEYARKLRTRNYKRQASSQKREELGRNNTIMYQLRSRKQPCSEHLREDTSSESENREDSSNEESSGDQNFKRSESPKRPATSDEDLTEDRTSVGDELESRTVFKESDRAEHKQSSSVQQLVGSSLLNTKFELNVEKLQVSTESSDQQPSDHHLPKLRSTRREKQLYSIQQRNKHKQSPKASSPSQKNHGVFSSDEDGNDEVQKHDGSPSVLGRHSPRLRRRRSKRRASSKESMHSEISGDSTTQESEYEVRQQPSVSPNHPLHQSTKDDVESKSEEQTNMRRKSPRKRKAVLTDTSDRSTHDENELSMTLRSRGNKPMVTQKEDQENHERTKSSTGLRPSKKRQRRSHSEFLEGETFSEGHTNEVELDDVTRRQDSSSLSYGAHDMQTDGDGHSNVDQNGMDVYSQHASPPKLITWAEFASRIVSSQTESDSLSEFGAGNQSRRTKRRALRHHGEIVSGSVTLKHSAEHMSSNLGKRTKKRVRFLSESEESDPSDDGTLSETDQQLIDTAKHFPFQNYDAVNNAVVVHLATSSPRKSPQTNKNIMSISSAERTSENEDRELHVASEVTVGELEVEKSLNGPSTIEAEAVLSHLTQADHSLMFDLSKSLNESTTETQHPKAVAAHKQLTRVTRDGGAPTCSSSISTVLSDVLSSNFSDSDDGKRRKTRGRKRGRRAVVYTNRNSRPRKTTNIKRPSKRRTSKRTATPPRTQITSSPLVKSPAHLSRSPKPTNSSLTNKSPLLTSPEFPLLNDEPSQPSSQPLYVVVAHSDEDMEQSMSQSQPHNAPPVVRFERLHRESSQGSETTSVISGTTSATDSPCKQNPQLYDLNQILLRKCY